MNTNRSHRRSVPAVRQKLAPSTTIPFSPPKPIESHTEDTVRGRNLGAETSPEFPSPMNALDRLRTQSLAATGGRTPDMYPLVGRCIDYAREEEIRKATNQKRPTEIVLRKTPANDAAGPPININQTQITSGADGKLDTSEWMHSWWGHACGCGEEETSEVRRVNGRQV